MDMFQRNSEADNAWTMLVMDQLVFPAIYYHFNLLYMYIKRWKKTRLDAQRLRKMRCRFQEPLREKDPRISSIPAFRSRFLARNGRQMG